MDQSVALKVPWVPAGLAFVAGFADTASFVGANGIFCAHVTGNFVVLAADLARHAHRDEWLKLTTFPIFVIAVLVATRAAAYQSSARARTCMLTTGALLLAAAVIGALVSVQTSAAAKAAVVALMVLAMGVQNAMHRLNPGLGPMTTVMTGNVTGFLADIVKGSSAPADVTKWHLVGWVIVGFALGCGLGGFGIAWFGFGVLLVPVVVIALVASATN